MFLCDGIGEGKAEPRAALTAFADKGLKKAAADMLWHPLAGIGDGHEDVAGRVLDGQEHFAPAGRTVRGLRGVEQQIVDSSLQLLWVHHRYRVLERRVVHRDDDTR